MSRKEPEVGTPRWVKIFGLVALVVVIVFVVVRLAGVGGDHGPGRHTPGGAPAEHTPPAGGHTQP